MPTLDVDFSPQPGFVDAAPAHVNTRKAAIAVCTQAPKSHRIGQSYALCHVSGVVLLARTRNGVEDEMASVAEIVPGVLHRCLKAVGAEQVIQRVEIAGDQVDPGRELEAAQVLKQKANAGSHRLSTGHPQHRRRTIDAVETVAELRQVQKKSPGSATEIRRRSEADAVPVAAALEGCPDQRRRGITHDPIVTVSESLIGGDYRTTNRRRL